MEQKKCNAFLFAEPKFQEKIDRHKPDATEGIRFHPEPLPVRLLDELPLYEDHHGKNESIRFAIVV